MPLPFNTEPKPPSLTIDSEARLQGWSEAELWLFRTSPTWQMSYTHAVRMGLSETDRFRFIAYHCACQSIRLTHTLVTAPPKFLIVQEKIQNDREAQSSKLHDQDPCR